MEHERNGETAKRRNGVALGIYVALLTGCAEDDPGLGDPQEEGMLVQALAELDGPPELAVSGRRFVRADLVDQGDLAALREGAARYEEGSREFLAHTLRDTMLSEEHGVYLELEPNFELADQVLEAQARVDRGETLSSPHAEPREDRIVWGPDSRTIASTAYPNSPIGFQELGCTGTLIGPNRIYTAAHCVYDNRTNDDAAMGWLCSDNSVNPAGCVTGRTIFAITGLTTCSKTTYVSNSWTQNTDGVVQAPSTDTHFWKRARYDRARVMLSCSPGNTTGWLGTKVLAGSGFFSGTIVGFPSRVPCPHGSNGGGDCPNGVNQYSGGPAPFTAAMMYTHSSSFKSGDEQSSHTWRHYIDTTGGQSGAPLLHDSDYMVVGNNVNGNNDKNKGNRVTSEVFTWLFQ